MKGLHRPFFVMIFLMQVSAEIRYWWRNGAPNGLADWFAAGEFRPGGGITRVDEYLRQPGQAELGIKRRGEKPGVEIKGLVALGQDRSPEPFSGRVEIWSKWSSAVLRIDPAAAIAISKQRWLRKFDTGAEAAREIALDERESPASGEPLPREGCNFEWTILRLPDGVQWWTLGLEAFGSLNSVERNLERAIAAVAAREPPQLRPDLVASYPAWLNR